MASKDKIARDTQKAYWEGVLSSRLADLSERGFDKETIAKDTSVRKIRATIRRIGARLIVIDGKQQKIEEKAKLKAEKAAMPKEEKSKKAKGEEESAEMSKRQQKIEKKLEKKKEKKQGKENQG